MVILKEILKTPSALGRFHGDLGFVGTRVKQEIGLTGVNGLGLDDVLILSLSLI